jgi:small subunit ribosomal protein S7
MEQKNQKKHSMNSFYSLNPRIIRFLMKDGKKSKAQYIFRKTLEILQNSSVSKIALQNIQPIFEIKRVRVAGATREVPCLVPLARQEGLALRWLVSAAQERKRKNPSLFFEECLATEILEASKGVGIARQKRDQLHKTAEANRAFVHYLLPR